MKKYSRFRVFISQANLSNYEISISILVLLLEIEFWVIFFRNKENDPYHVLLISAFVVLSTSIVGLIVFIKQTAPAWKLMKKEIYLNHLASQELINLLKNIRDSDAKLSSLSKQRTLDLEYVTTLKDFLNHLNLLNYEQATAYLRSGYEEAKERLALEESYESLQEIEKIEKEFSMDPEIFKSKLILKIKEVEISLIRVSEHLNKVALTKQSNNKNFSELIDTVTLSDIQKANSDNNQT